MARLVDTRHKMAHLPVTSSVVAQLSRPNSRGATSVIVHASAPLVTPVRLVRLLHKSHHMDWRDSKEVDLEKTFRRIYFSNNNLKKAKIEKKTKI
jgi:hypothetical protein